MRLTPLLIAALSATVALCALAFPAGRAAAQFAANAQDPVLTWGGSNYGAESYTGVYDRSVAPPLTSHWTPAAETAAPAATAQVASPGTPAPAMAAPVAQAAPAQVAPAQVAPAQAAPAQAPPGQPAPSAAPTGPAPAKTGWRNEPLLNSGYWTNYVYDIGHFFTAPLRFDTADWIKTGAFVVAMGGAFAADKTIRDAVQGSRGKFSDDVASVGYRLGDSKTILFGALGGYAVGYGVSAFNQGEDYKIRETSLLVLQSFAISELFAEGTKRLAGRTRPNATDNSLDFQGLGGSSSGQSFFSGHAVNAFSTASVIAEQYGDQAPWVPPVAYSLAGLVAWSRLNDNAHWTSDVIMGAGVGYAVGKIVTHFSPFRGGDGPVATAMLVQDGGGIQLNMAF